MSLEITSSEIIPKYAFYNLIRLRKITLPDNLKVIGKKEHKNPTLMFIDAAFSVLITGSGLSDYINYKFYNKSIDSIILLAEKTIINEILLKVNTAIENKSRFKRFKGFNLTPADVEAKETIGNLKEELESIKETIKLN